MLLNPNVNISNGIFQPFSTMNTFSLLLDHLIDIAMLIINNYQMDKNGYVLSDPTLDKCTVIPPSFRFVSHYF